MAEKYQLSQWVARSRVHLIFGGVYRRMMIKIWRSYLISCNVGLWPVPSR